MQPFLTINGKKVYFSELLDISYRDTMVLDGYEEKTLEFCANWLSGVQEFLVHTSGSTGIPKPITLKREQMEASAKLTLDFFQLKKSDKVLVSLNTEVIGGKMMLVRGLIQELEMHIVNPVANPLERFDAEEIQFDFLSLVPYQLEAILSGPAEGKKQLDSAKAVLLGGAAIPHQLEEKIQQLEAPVFHSYGMTETCSHIALRKVNGDDRSELFSALPGVKLGLTANGALTISGPMTGGETIVTNDLAEILDGNKFKLLGRADDVINSGGIKVHPNLIAPTIEAAMASFGLNCRYFVAGLPHDLLGEEVTLVLEIPELQEEIIKQLLNSLHEQLPKFEAPRRLFCIAPFSETKSGKIDRIATLARL